MNIKDVLYKEENVKSDMILEEKKSIDIPEKKQEILKEEKKEKRVPKIKNKQNNKLLRYIAALVLDFLIFGVMILIITSLTNLPLIEISNKTSRVLVLNRITIIVICNILLFMYFYIYPKDHKGSTPMMNAFGVGVVSLKNKVTLVTSLLYNINFWIFLLVIDLGLVDSLNNVTINIYAFCILLLQFIILILLAGYSFIKVKIIVKEKDEK